MIFISMVAFIFLRLKGQPVLRLVNEIRRLVGPSLAKRAIEFTVPVVDVPAKLNHTCFVRPGSHVKQVD